ncbi:hypothetical protein MYAM1_000338 [Malassezia yamatoensis]|uniref:C2H2-type domain-containing protein n=1 Tax=Malassezia yamatoensis TaxID=253288 RepID=A0AAJ5YPB7_9BASI|nr:hypothetical protein MYAM1_000338 [Malassezia yamatoensis]
MNTRLPYEFDARMASKISVMDEVMNPILEKEPFLELAMRDVAHPTLSDTISTLSDSSEYSLMPAFAFTNGKTQLGEANEEYAMGQLPSPSNFSFGVYENFCNLTGQRSRSQVVGENLMMHNLTSTNPLSGDYTTNSFSLMSNPEHDLLGFLSQAVPLTQMTSNFQDGNAQDPVQALSNMPCILPMVPTAVPHTPPALPTMNPDYFPDSYRQIYSTSLGSEMMDPMVSVVKPIISRDAAVQNSLASVSLAVLRGSPTAASTSPTSKKSLTSVTEMGLIGNKRTSASRLYECPICHKMFERAYNRKMHITTHEAIENRLKPFFCPVESCGKRFARKHDKNRHYLGVHLRARKSGVRPSINAASLPQNHASSPLSETQQSSWGDSLLLQDTQPTVWSS